ncbi:Clp protease N-terminal domain-containing protein [Streptomyces sp. NPDC001404]|uniref:Clp protease N-terminal domain-containing protein n=1 Tax=Streptomyces sp. NPDC001404 TaxID=3364571 RepID=UPI00369ADB3F
MFERFTKEARTVVVLAQEEARMLHHSWIGSEHLLLGIASRTGAPGAATLERLGVTPPACRAAMAPAGAGELDEEDAAALSAIGIDLDAVRDRAEEVFGPGALDHAATPEQSRGRWRKAAKGAPKGHIPFTPRAKKVLERSLREALARKDNFIGTQHVLLGILDPADHPTAALLARLGTDMESVRAGLLAELEQAA